MKISIWICVAETVLTIFTKLAALVLNQYPITVTWSRSQQAILIVGNVGWLVGYLFALFSQ